MNPALDLYLDRLDDKIKQCSPAQTQRLLRTVGAKVRQANRMRIIANLQPDGNPMRPRKGGSKDYLNGYRKLRKNEKLRIGQPFIYDSPKMRQRNIGELREMVSLKTPQTDKKYGNRWYKHKGGGRYQRTPYDPDYVEGFALSRGGSLLQDGVSKFNRKFIYVPGEGLVSRLRQKMMFRKINQFKYLQLKATTHEAAIGFLNGLTAYIAAAHQYGEDNRPERTLLGFSDDDLALIEQTVMQHFQFS